MTTNEYVVVVFGETDLLPLAPIVPPIDGDMPQLLPLLLDQFNVVELPLKIVVEDAEKLQVTATGLTVMLIDFVHAEFQPTTILYVLELAGVMVLLPCPVATCKPSTTTGTAPLEYQLSVVDSPRLIVVLPSAILHVTACARAERVRASAATSTTSTGMSPRIRISAS